MKTIVLVVLLMSVMSCKNTDKKEGNTPNEATQQTELTSTMKRFNITDETVTKDWNGKVISKETFMKYLKGGEYIYIPKTENGKLVEAQLQKPTAEQLEMLNKMTKPDNESEKPAPDFEVKDINGKTYKLSDLKDKTLVLNFWFTTCKPCITEMPELNELVEKNKNAVFIAFATDKEQRVAAFLKKHPFKYNIVANAKDIAEKYGVSAYPTHFMIKNGMIKNKFIGYSPNIQSELQAAIDGKVFKETKAPAMKEQFMLNSDSDIRDASGKKLEMMDAVKLINTQKYTMENAVDENGNKYILIMKK